MAIRIVRAFGTRYPAWLVAERGWKAIPGGAETKVESKDAISAPSPGNPDDYIDGLVSIEDIIIGN